MRDYSVVSTGFFTGDFGRSIRGQHFLQALAGYLIYGPAANMIQLYRLPPAYAAADLGSSFEGALEGLRSLSEGGFCLYDEEHEIVWVVDGARQQLGECIRRNDNRHKLIVKLLQEVRKSSLSREFLDRYGEAFDLTEKDLRSPFEGPSKPLSKPGSGSGAGSGAGSASEGSSPSENLGEVPEGPDRKAAAPPGVDGETAAGHESNGTEPTRKSREPKQPDVLTYPPKLLEAIPDLPARWAARMAHLGRGRVRISAQNSQLTRLAELLPVAGADAICGAMRDAGDAAWQTMPWSRLAANGTGDHRPRVNSPANLQAGMHPETRRRMEEEDRLLFGDPVRGS